MIYTVLYSMMRTINTIEYYSFLQSLSITASILYYAGSTLDYTTVGDDFIVKQQ